MNPADVYRRARAAQRTILARGGPHPDMRRQYEKAVAILDAWDRQDLGIAPLIVLKFALVAAAAALTAIIGYQVARAAPAIGDAAVDLVSVAKWSVGIGIVVYAIGLARRVSRRPRRTERTEILE